MATDGKTKAAEAEAAAVRRRWITLGEFLGVAAVLISALTFWNSYSERRNAEAERIRSAQSAEIRIRSLVLKGTPESGGRNLVLTVIGEQAIQSQTIAFPSPLRVAPVETTSARIEADWFDDALRRARRAAHGNEANGDARLPVAVTTRFVADGEMFTDVSIYDLGYSVEDRLLGDRVRLKGLSLGERARAGQAQARIDALWKARQPTISSGEKK